MELLSLTLIQASHAVDLAGSAKLSDPARALLKPALTPKDYLAELLERKLFKDAYSFLVVGLPLREAVWWGALCLRQSHGDVSVPGPDRIALRAAVEWVLEPTAETRRVALAAGKEAGLNSASGCLALAAGQTPAALATPTAPPTAHPAVRYLRRAVLLASVHGDPRVLGPYAEHFVKLGLGVAAGEYTWKRLIVLGSGKNRPVQH